MTDNIEKRVEKLMSECECTGYTCRHETSERHAIVFDIDIEQALKETREETLREERQRISSLLIKLLAEKEGDYKALEYSVRRLVLKNITNSLKEDE